MLFGKLTRWKSERTGKTYEGISIYYSPRRELALIMRLNGKAVRPFIKFFRVR